MAELEYNKFTFEQAMAELEKIVTDVEQGKISLEDSIEKYEKGMKLIQHCRAVLEQAEKRIETISNQNQTTRESSEEGPDDS